MKTTSLELSQRLKALGVPQVSEFYWYKSVYTIENPTGWVIGGQELLPYEGEKYSTFTSDELGEMLEYLIINGYINVETLGNVSKVEELK